MTNEDRLLFAIPFLTLILFLFSALYLRDIIRLRFQSGRPRVPGCLSAPLQAAICFLASFILAKTPKLLPVTTWVLTYFGGMLCSLASFVLIGLGIAALFRWNSVFGTLKDDERNAILDELALCMERGLPLEGILTALANERRGQIMYYASEAAKRLHEGAALSTALEARTMFPPHVIASIKAAEISGGSTLPEILRRLSREFQTDREVRTSMKIGLVYAAFLVLMLIPLIFFECVTVAPKIDQIFRALKASWYTNHAHPPALLWWSSLSSALLTGLLVLVAILVNMMFAIEGLQLPRLGNTPSWIATRVRWLRRKAGDEVPLVRHRMRAECLSRAANVMSALISAHAPLQAAARAASHPDIAGPYSKSLLKLAAALDEGKPLKEALTISKLPATFVIFFQAGENTGDLDKLLQTAAEYWQAKKARLERTIAILIPLILLPAIGALVGLSYIGTLSAINEIERILSR